MVARTGSPRERADDRFPLNAAADDGAGRTGEQDAFDDITDAFQKLLMSDLGAAGEMAGTFAAWQDVSTEQRARRDHLLGCYHRAKGKHHAAFQFAREALDAATQAGDRNTITRCRLLLFDLHLNAGRYDRAWSVADQGLSDPTLVAGERCRFLVCLGNLEHRRGRFALARRHFDAALRQLDGTWQTQARLAHSRACLDVSENRFGDANRGFGEALRIYRRHRAALPQATTLQASGNLYALMGQYFRAESRLRRAKQMFSERGDPIGAAYCHRDLFALDLGLNRFEEAFARLEPLIADLESLDLTFEKGDLLLQAAKGAFRFGETGWAEGLLEEAVEIFDQAHNPRYGAWCALLQAEVLGSMRQTPLALGRLKDAHAWFVAAGDREGELEALLLQGHLTGSMPTPKQARRIKLLLRHVISPRIRTQALVALADGLAARGQLKRAIDCVTEAIISIEETRASIGSFHARERYFVDKTEIYERLCRWLFHWKNKAGKRRLLQAIELSRSRQMAEHLARADALPPVVNTSEPALMKLSRQSSRVAQLERKMERMDADPARSDVERAVLAEEVRHARERLHQLSRGLRDESRLGLYYPLDLNPEDIGRILPNGTMVVAYFVEERGVYRIELDRIRLTTRFQPLTRGFWSDYHLLMRFLGNPNLPGRSRIPALIEDVSRALMLTIRRDIEHIIFVPHKALHAFPFALLTSPKRRLIDSLSVSQCPSLSALYFTLRRTDLGLKRPLFLLPESVDDPDAAERVFLKRRFPAATVFDRLSDPRVIEHLAQSDFIHFAGHGFFNPVQPGASYLSLGRDRLYLVQFRNLKLRSAFVNLAACRSGAVVPSSGNELHGFAISFLAVGATTVLAGLWDIDDRATGVWMTEFYRHIDHGVANAFRSACRKTQRIWPDPHYWAGFCLLGKPGSSQAMVP